MKTILVPVSRQLSADRIKKYAAFFAPPGKCRLHLLHVLTVPQQLAFADVVVSEAEDLLEETRMAEEKEVDKMAEQLREAGYVIDVSTPVGFLDKELTSLESKLDPALIIMFTSGSHSVVEDIFGTNTSHVFERMHAPVLVIHNELDVLNIKKVMVGLHPEDGNLKGLKNVLELSNELQWDLRFVKIDNDFQMDVVGDDVAHARIEEILPGKMNHIVHRKENDSAKGLVKYADEWNADLIVLFTVKRHFLDKLFRKSVTRDLVLHAKKPLLIYHY